MEGESQLPLIGEYEPSTLGWARDQAELYERSGGPRALTMDGLPVAHLYDRWCEIQKTPQDGVDEGRTQW